MHEARYTKTSLECYEVMQIAFGDKAVRDFMLLNAFKYLWRYQHKGGIADLDKALDYIAEIKEMGFMEASDFDHSKYETLKATIIKHRIDAIQRRKRAITNVPPESDNPYQE